MTAQFNVSLLIRGDGSDAEQALKKTGSEVRRLGEATEATGRRTAVLGAAQRRAAGDADLLAAANRRAAGSVGNLAAQFNDIGVMLAAGQNPLQLALQQGTQIGQVLGPLGAGGAVRALGAGLLAMVNPVTLLTIGSIAAGAAMFQWLRGAGEEAQTLEEQVKGLAEQIDSYREAAERANASTADMAQKFGLGAEAARTYLRDLTEIERREAERAARAAARGLPDKLATELGISFPLREIGDQQELGDIFGLSVRSRESRRQINAVGNAMNNLANADGVEDRIAALERLRDKFEKAAMASGSFSDQEDAALRQINQVLVEQQRLLALIETDRRARAQASADAYLTERAGERGDSPREVRRRIADTSARTDIAELRQEAELRSLIAAYGRDSAEVAAARRDADRAVYAALVGQRDVSAALKAELMAAWEAAQGIPSAMDLAQGFAAALEADLTAAWNAANGVAGANMAGPISAAAAAAAGLAGFLQAAAAAAWSAAQGRVAAQAQLGQMAIAFSPGGQALLAYGARGGQTPAQRALEARNTVAAPSGTGAGGAGGGGGAAARDEADAVEELIARLRGEIEVAREADPVQRELLNLRRELTGATGAQRAEVEELIRSREREREAMEALNYVSEQTGDALIDALMGADDAGKNLIRTLARAVLQAALLGQGPLAALFGGKGLFGATPGGGGILGAIFGGLLKRKAGGGWIDGPGGPTDDRVPALLSNGEFVVRAAAAARNRAVLEAINGGAVPRFARGGVVGGGSAAGGDPGAAAAGRVRIELGPGLRAEILDAARTQSFEIVETGIRAYDQTALPGRVQAIGRDPRRRD